MREMTEASILRADCLEAMRDLEPCSVDSVVTDPPYGLSFMGKDWDHGIPGVHFWEAALRVAKPGAHLLAFGGTRTFHRLAVAIEEAGWEIRDTVMWVYGSGFPKSYDVSKAIDREAGAERAVVGPGRWNGVKGSNAKQAGCLIRPGGQHDETAPATAAAREWSGWGTALKPAWEPIIVARKPLEGTVAANVLRYGTGAINVDGCRIESGGTHRSARSAGRGAGYEAHNKPDRKYSAGLGGIISEPHAAGRWPANLIHDGSEEVVGLFPESSGEAFPGVRNTSGYSGGLDQGATPHGFRPMGDSGSAARFFYCAKASRADRNEGLEGWAGRIVHEDKWSTKDRRSGEPRNPRPRDPAPVANHHPTVKPTALMRYLCRLVTPPGGLVLDPFCGSGSTGKAAVLEGFRFLGIELDPEYVEIAEARIRHSAPEGTVVVTEYGKLDDPGDDGGFLDTVLPHDFE